MNVNVSGLCVGMQSVMELCCSHPRVKARMLATHQGICCSGLTIVPLYTLPVQKLRSTVLWQHSRSQRS